MSFPCALVLAACLAPVFDDIGLVLDADPSIPTPAEVVGHEIGDGAIRYDDLLRYFEQLADSSPRATLVPHGRTHEGRMLFHLIVTSETNHASLAEIQSRHAMLGDPRRAGSNAVTDEIAANDPAVAWMSYCIHGDEPSGTDAAVLLAYALVAGETESIRQLRNDVVVLIDPLQNPDGRERWLAQLRTFEGSVSNPDYQSVGAGLWSSGRTNHYRFDLNRDWLMLGQPETRGRVQAIQRWNPQLLVDAHEMGSLDTYLFDPPREPIHPALSEEIASWRRRFSSDQAQAFDQHGWSYYTQEWYEEWYPGYTNAWANLRGTIGLLYEQSATDASAVTLESGEIMTFAQAVGHQLVSSLANLETLRVNRVAVMQAYLADRRWALSDAEELSGTFLVPPHDDLQRSDRLVSILRANGIEFSIASETFAARGVRGVYGAKRDEQAFPAGTLIVRSRQPLRRLLHALLDFDPRMSEAFLKKEREQIERHRGSELYDITAWNLPMAFGLNATWAQEIDAVATTGFDPPPAVALSGGAAYGYIANGRDSRLPTALARLFQRGCTVRAATRSFGLGEEMYPIGTLLLRRHENGDDLEAILEDVQRETGVRFEPAHTALSVNGRDLGGRRFPMLHAPRVGLLCQWPFSSSSFGAMWHDLDHRVGVRISPISGQQLGGLDLRRYNVLIMPDGYGLSRLLGAGGLSRLKTWVREGGTLIAVGNAAAYLADADGGLSQVRRRRDVLDQLDLYAEVVDRERAARNVQVDQTEVWADEAVDEAPGDNTEGASESDTSDAPAAKSKGGGDSDALKREDTFRRLFSPSGAFARAQLDEQHWLTAGLGPQLPVLVSGSTVLLSLTPESVPVRLAPAESLRLSGLMWPEARERLADSAWATVESVGRGQVILFAGVPVFRGYTDGTGRLFRNAVLLGPGLGASQPVPW